MARRKSRSEFKIDINPIRRCDYMEVDAQAIRALQRGTANKRQQQLALDFIINDICRTYDTAYRKSRRATDVMIGRIACGQDIVHFLNAAPTVADLDKIAVREHFAAQGDEANEQNDGATDQPEAGSES